MTAESDTPADRENVTENRDDEHNWGFGTAEVFIEPHDMEIIVDPLGETGDAKFVMSSDELTFASYLGESEARQVAQELLDVANMGDE